jgi:hypothetical protein
VVRNAEIETQQAKHAPGKCLSLAQGKVDTVRSIGTISMAQSEYFACQPGVFRRGACH